MLIVLQVQHIDGRVHRRVRCNVFVFEDVHVGYRPAYVEIVKEVRLFKAERISPIEYCDLLLR